MQVKKQLYIGKIVEFVDKINVFVDEKRAKNWAKSKAVAGHTMKNTAPPRAFRGQGFNGGSAPDCLRDIKKVAHTQCASR